MCVSSAFVKRKPADRCEILPLLRHPDPARKPRGTSEDFRENLNCRPTQGPRGPVAVEEKQSSRQHFGNLSSGSGKVRAGGKEHRSQGRRCPPGSFQPLALVPKISKKRQGRHHLGFHLEETVLTYPPPRAGNFPVDRLSTAACRNPTDLSKPNCMMPSGRRRTMARKWR